jgi:manganese/zinc/iron transport system substrate-binding protein
MHLGKLFVVAVILAALTACTQNREPQASSSDTSPKFKILATTGMLADLAQNICPDLCEVESLMGPGIDPHLYKPTAGDLKKIQDSQLVLHGGFHLEGRMTEILESLGDKSYSCEESIPATSVITNQNQPDPHIWHDPIIWKDVATGLSQKLAEILPDHKATFLKTAESYKAQLDTLDQEVRSIFEPIPAGKRILITAHDAFSYFGKRYQIEVKGIQGTNTVAEASATTISDLAKIIADKKIGAIFIESSVNPATIRALQKAVIDRGHNVRIGGQLYSDALGSPGTPESTVIGMIKTNANLIAQGIK